MKLTDVAIRNAKSKSKPFKMYDSHGLFILIKPGGSKLWRWRYRFDGKEKLMALGSYPLIGLSQARDLHFADRTGLTLIWFVYSRRVAGLVLAFIGSVIAVGTYYWLVP